MKKILLILVAFLFSMSLFAHDIINLSAKLINDNKVEIKWATDNELNIAYFIVNRSVSNEKFIEINKLQAKGYSTSYTYLDENIDYGIKYLYNISIIKKDSSKVFSDPVLIKIPTNIIIIKIQPDIQIHPNPFIDNFMIKNIPIGSDIDIYNNLANKVIPTYNNIGSPSLSVSELSYLTPGVYFVRVNKQIFKVIKY